MKCRPIKREIDKRYRVNRRAEWVRGREANRIDSFCVGSHIHRNGSTKALRWNERSPLMKHISRSGGETMAVFELFLPSLRLPPDLLCGTLTLSLNLHPDFGNITELIARQSTCSTVEHLLQRNSTSPQHQFHTRFQTHIKHQLSI